MDNTKQAIIELLALANQRREAALEELEGAKGHADTGAAYDMADSLGQAGLMCGDAELFCRLADALAADDGASVTLYWNSMDTDPREAVYDQAPTAHKLVEHYVKDDVQG